MGLSREQKINRMLERLHGEIRGMVLVTEDAARVRQVCEAGIRDGEHELASASTAGASDPGTSERSV